MLLHELVAVSAAVAATASRRAKVERLADGLRGLAPDEVAAGVAFLAGELRQRQIGVGWAALRDPPAPAESPSLSVAELDAVLERVGTLAGPGSQAERRRTLGQLLAQTTDAEARWLRSLLLGGVRQGALQGVLVEAVARAAEVGAGEVRRALMLRGDLGEVAQAAFAQGAPGLRALGLEVGRPVQPMLAQPAEDVAGPLGRLGRAAVEVKLDGARVQVHRAEGDVCVFTRSLDDITARVPELVEAALALPVRAAVLDGEAVALRADGRPEPFQVTASRLGSSVGVADLRAALPLTPFLFDVLHVDGEDLLDRSGAERAAALAAVVPASGRVGRVEVEEVDTAEGFLRDALARGHEGVMVKSLAAPYEAGRRGASWFKVKPRHTLDLVVLAAEWGHGRRQGWLSNLHLGAREPAGDGLVMLGKTFKGLTDAMLAWQTERLLALELARDGHTVHVRPELVVEVAFDGVQRSPRYPGGVTLRFARVLRHRPDKPAREADTLDAVLALHGD